ncbi:MAG: hypothetical protein U0Q16_15955 [Bryobacteraceae bacterium]
MTIQITQPEVEALIQQRMQSGAFATPEEVVLDALRSSKVAQPATPESTRTVLEEGLGLFGSPEDSALLDEVVSLAYEERRRPSGTPSVL